MRGIRAVLTVLAAALALAAATPAAAGLYELFPTNARSADGVFRGALVVWIDRRDLVEFRVDRGEIDPATVRDARRAIAFVVERYGLSPARDVVFYCPIGIIGVACRVPPDPDDWLGGFDPTNRVVRWP
jgi:hypothetical protein